jgi:hypothetical protein
MNTLEVIRLSRLAMEHWKVHQPTLYRDLKNTDRLKPTAEQAAKRTLLDRDSLMASGLTQQEAWEIVRDRYLFLATEPTTPAHNDTTDILQDLMKILQAAETE